MLNHAQKHVTVILKMANEHVIPFFNPGPAKIKDVIYYRFPLTSNKNDDRKLFCSMFYKEKFKPLLITFKASNKVLSTSVSRPGILALNMHHW